MSINGHYIGLDRGKVDMGYRDHASPAVLRAKANDLIRLAHEHRTERNLAEDLVASASYLGTYADLVERMYVKSLKQGYGGKPGG